MSTKHIGDIGKDAKDLITQDFPADGIFKITTQSKTSGLTIKSTINRFVKKDKSGLKEIISGSLEPKFEWNEKNIEFTGKLVTTNEFSGGFSAKDWFVKGSKLDLLGTQSDRDGTALQIGGAIKSDNFATKLNATYPFFATKKDKKPVTLTGEATFQYSNLSFAALGIVNTDDFSPKGDVAIAYSQKPYEVVARGTYDKKTENPIWGASFYHQISQNLKYAIDFSADQLQLRGSIATAASEYKLDDSTTVKGKWAVKLTDTSKQTELRLGLSVKQKINSYITAVCGADLNLRNLLGESIGDAHSFGLELKLQD